MSFTTPTFEIGSGLWKLFIHRRQSNSTSSRDSGDWIRSVAATATSNLARHETGSAVAKATGTTASSPSGNGGGAVSKRREIKEGTLEAIVAEVLVSVLASALIGAVGLGIWNLSRIIAQALTGEDGGNDVDQFNSGAAARLHELLKKRGRAPKKPLRLSSHETHLAEDIVDPDDIDDSFADIGGLDELKQEIWELAILPLLRPELFRSKSKLLQQPSGILLYGKPGCGKTLLAKAIAKESSAVFIPIKLSKILNKWVGESNKLVAATFSLARKLAPSIIFLDEVDCFLSDSVDPSASKSMESLKAEFLTLWDGITTNKNHAPVLVLGATNRPHLIDSAILRRMPRTFAVPLPNAQGREQIIRIMMQDQDMEKDVDAFLTQLAEDYTSGYSGSDLKELCRTAAREPIRTITQDLARRAVNGEKLKVTDEEVDEKIPAIKKSDFLEALKKVKRSGQVAKEYGRKAAQESAVENIQLDQEQLLRLIHQCFPQMDLNQLLNSQNSNNNGSNSDDVPNI